MLHDFEFARHTQTGIEIRPGALRLRWDLTELTTSDGHLARGAFTTSTRALPQPNELKMLDEALFGSRSAVTLADVVAHFSEAISAAARKHARAVEAQTLLGDEGKQALTTALMQAAGAVAFCCGIELLPPAQVDLDCPTLQRQRFEEMQRQTAQRRAADQVADLRHSAELFGQFEAIRAAAPQLSPGQVLGRVAVADQADVFRAGPGIGRERCGGNLWAVAERNLVRIDRGESIRPEILDIPPDLGPLRSVRSDGAGGLLLGCRAGVLRVNPESPPMPPDIAIRKRPANSASTPQSFSATASGRRTAKPVWFAGTSIGPTSRGLRFAPGRRRSPDSRQGTWPDSIPVA